MSKKIVTITAGLSQPSATRLLADRLADAVTTAVSARGDSVDTDLIELRELAHDLATTMTSGMPTPAVAHARDLVTGAAGLIAVTPVFAASYSGLFKSFVDVLNPDAMNGMPVLIAATAGTERHQLVLDYAMRPLFSYLRAQVLPTGVFAATSDFGGDTALTDRIRRAADELASRAVAVMPGLAETAPGQTRHRHSGNRVPELTTDFEDLLSQVGH